jgi:hypothetical protein
MVPDRRARCLFVAGFGGVRRETSAQANEQDNMKRA